ncbi:MAG: hypothetical protein ACRDZ7_09715 [Acidimicrobiia bacterium]
MSGGMDLEVVAREVERRAHGPASGRPPARLFGVRVDVGGTVVLEELGRGEARDLPRRVRPPAGLAALALTATAWAAPMEADGTLSVRPGCHPHRRHVRLTVVIAGAGEDVTILRDDGSASPQVLRGGTGVVHDRLVRCWARRPEAAATGGH